MPCGDSRRLHSRSSRTSRGAGIHLCARARLRDAAEVPRRPRRTCLTQKRDVIRGHAVAHRAGNARERARVGCTAGQCRARRQAAVAGAVFDAHADMPSAGVRLVNAAPTQRWWRATRAARAARAARGRATRDNDATRAARRTVRARVGAAGVRTIGGSHSRAAGEQAATDEPKQRCSPNVQPHGLSMTRRDLGASECGTLVPSSQRQGRFGWRRMTRSAPAQRSSPAPRALGLRPRSPAASGTSPLCGMCSAMSSTTPIRDDTSGCVRR